MKVVLINGSPRRNGCTAYCLKYIQKLFEQDGVNVVLLDIPNDIKHCINCRRCKADNSVCSLSSDVVAQAAQELADADGLIIGSPVYYYSITSQLQAFITRLMYSRPKILEHKLCSFFSVSRRTGNTNAFDQVMKVFQMHNAMMVGGTYVNEIYGDNPDELQYDKEGLLSLQVIEKNFVTMLPLIKTAEFYNPKKIHTNFISREYLNLLKTKNTQL